MLLSGKFFRSEKSKKAIDRTKYQKSQEERKKMRHKKMEIMGGKTLR